MLCERNTPPSLLKRESERHKADPNQLSQSKASLGGEQWQIIISEKQQPHETRKGKKL